MQDGLEQIGNAFMQFPVAVWDDIVDAFGTTGSTAAADLAAAALTI